MIYAIIDKWDCIIETFGDYEHALEQLSEWDNLHNYTQGYEVVQLFFELSNDLGETVAICETEAEAVQKSLMMQADDAINGTYQGAYKIERKRFEAI
jgi:hypothetical protein